MNINRPAESGLHGLALLSSFPVSLTGLGFFRSWITLLTSDGVVTGLNGPTHDLALSIVLVVLALFDAVSHRYSKNAGRLSRAWPSHFAPRRSSWESA